MALSSQAYPADVDEFALTGATPIPSHSVRCPRVAAAPVNLECRLGSAVPIATSSLVVGKGGAHLHAHDDVVAADVTHLLRFEALARLGGGGFGTPARFATTTA